MSHQFTRFFTAAGDGTGSTSFTGNYSATETRFRMQAQEGESIEVHRLLVFVEDSKINADDYGAIAAGLTNGIALDIRTGSTIAADLTAGHPVQTSADWGRFCYDVDSKAWGAGNEFLVARWTFERHGEPIVLRGSTFDRLVISCKDNLTGLVEHSFSVQGIRSVKRSKVRTPIQDAVVEPDVF